MNDYDKWLENKIAAIPKPRTDAGNEFLGKIRQWAEDEGARWSDLDEQTHCNYIRAIEDEAFNAIALYEPNEEWEAAELLRQREN